MSASTPNQLPHSQVSSTDSQRADQAVSKARLVTDAGDLEACAAIFAESPAIGLDTEFVRERTFYPRPGLVQISDGNSVALLDAVALPEMPALAGLLDQTAQVKILHSVGEDLEVLRMLTSTLPSPLFDTQIAAAMLGFPLQCRYENLVFEVLGVELAGGKARSDWCKRPLNRDLLRYAAQDVIWLPRLHAWLGEALEMRDRLSWLKEDCARLVAAANSEAAQLPLLRVKGAGNLSDSPLAVLSRLAEWRDQEAKRRNLPRSFIVRDDGLLSLAGSSPGADRDRRLRALPPALIRRYADQLVEIMEGGPDPDFLRPPALEPLSPDQRAEIKACQTSVAAVARELGVEPALLASRRDITRVIRGEKPDWLSGWRGQFLGDILGR